MKQLIKEGHKEMKNILTRLKLTSVVTKIYQILFNLLGVLPKDKNLVVFESFLGRQYSCNPRAIYEYLRENYPEYRLIWSVDKRYVRTFDEKGIQYIKRLSIKWLFTVPRAKYWVINSRMPQWIKKPKNTIYLQTWHGTPLKKLGTDIEEVHMPETTTEKYREGFLRESQKWDYLISPNPYSTKIFSRAFHVDRSRILETGYPRNDELIVSNSEENIQVIKNKLGIPHGKKVILYAPTWRDDEYFAKGQYKFSLHMNLSLLQDTLKDEYVIVLRLHYLISNRLDVSKYKDFVFDHSSYGDIRDLYLISDLLITDYSSVFFDYLCLKRPIIFYTYDIDSYRDILRGFYFDFEKNAPGPLVRTTESLIDEIKRYAIENSTSTNKKLVNYYNKFCQLEHGVSTEMVVKSVFSERVVK